MKRQREEIRIFRRDEVMKLDPDIDYWTLPVPLSTEVKELLARARPSSLGAARRAGVSPSSLISLMQFAKNARRAPQREEELPY